MDETAMICAWCGEQFEMPEWTLEKIAALENKNNASWVCKGCAEKLRPIASKEVIIQDAQPQYDRRCDGNI